MKRLYLFFAVFVVFLSVGLLTACGAKVNIAIESSQSEDFSVVLYLKGEDNPLDYEHEKGINVKKGKSVVVHLTLADNFDAEKVNLHANEKRLELSQSIEQQMLIAEFTANENTKLTVKNIVRSMHTIQMPSGYEAKKYTYARDGQQIFTESIKVNHGEDLTITVTPKDKNNSAPDYIRYFTGEYAPLKIEGAATPHRDMLTNVIEGADNSVDYTLKSVEASLTLEFSYMDDWRYARPVSFDLHQSTEYMINPMVYDKERDSFVLFTPNENVYADDMYFSLGLESEHAKNLIKPVMVINGEEYLPEEERFYKGYYRLPNEKITSHITAYLKEFEIDLEDADLYSGVFTNNVIERDGKPLNFIRGNFYPRGYNENSYVHNGKAYLKVGDTLYVPEDTYGKSTNLTSPNGKAKFDVQREEKAYYYGGASLYTKYIITELEEGFELVLSSSALITLPFESWANDFKIEYLIGEDLSAQFIEVKTYEDRIVEVKNHNSIVIKLTPLNADAYSAHLVFSDFAEVVGYERTIKMKGVSFVIRHANIQLPDKINTYYAIKWLLNDIVVTDSTDNA